MEERYEKSVKGIGRVSLMKSKVTGKSDSPRRSWTPLSERVSNKPGDIVVNAQHVSQYNPVTGQVVREIDKVQQPKVKPAVEDTPKEKPATMKEKLVVVKEKPAGVTSKVSKGKDDVVKAPVVADEVPVVADKVLVVKATVADKALVVKATVADNVVVDKEPVKEKSGGSVGKAPVKDKGNLLVDVVPDDIVLNKAMGKASVKDKFKAPVKDKVEDNVKALVKDNNNVKASVKDKPKQKVIPTVQELSEVLVLRSSNQKVKPEVKSKVDDRVSETDDVDSSFDEESDEESVPKKGKKKLTKKVKKEESDEESVPKKGKKKEKKLTPEEDAHEEYLSSFLTFDQIRSKLGRFIMSNFNPKTYMLSLDSGDKIEVTHSKIHEILGVHVGGYSLFHLDEREADHEFVRLVAAQEIDFLFKVNFLTLFTNTMGKCAGLKGQICLDVVRRLREDSVIFDIDWCGYIYDCIQGSKLPEGTNHYLGPLTFLILLYLYSTKFDRFPIVRTRPAIKNWSLYLMKKRQDLELKDHVLGVLDLYGEWTEVEVQDGKGFIGSLKTSEKKNYSSTFGEIHDFFKKSKEKLSLICAERVMLKEYIRKASLEYPGDVKFLALHEKYINLFKDPISFNDDRNGDIGGDDNDGDDDANDGDGNGDNGGDDDGNRDNDGDDYANEGDGNRDEEDANEGDKDPNGRNLSFGFTKISLDDFGNDSGPTEKESVDPTEQGTVIDGNLVEECEIMSTPENYTQCENVFEAHCGKFIVFGIRLNLETLAPAAESKSRHFFLTGCIKKLMFDGILDSDDAKLESFSNQVKAQFHGNDGGLTLEGINLSYQNNSDDYT
uniref:Ulp1 protease family, C-terminal catalytic domain-containing protein n=1 Tax=Tanacetum cinerariifolium TaxID=118510 RepID=A0A6L2MT18_TANCI|nr:hypothetical protein [Tanacetum cinerariifolium]